MHLRENLNSEGQPMERLLTTKDLSELLGVSTRTIVSQRIADTGCPFIKIGAKVLYDPSGVHGWVNAQKRQSTSEEAGTDEK